MAAIFPQWPGIASQKPVHVVVILGSARRGRISERVATYVQNVLKSMPSVTSEFVDVRNFNFPQDDYGISLKDRFPKYGDAVRRGDAFLIVTPEYNHGYPGQLKSLLDVLYPEYKHKAVAVVGVSSGPWGGVRVVENLLPVFRELGLVVSQMALNIARAEETFSPQGVPIDSRYDERAKRMIEDLVWLATALRWGRSNL